MDNLLRKKKAQLNPSACCGDCIAIICMKLLICSHPPYPIFFTPHLKFKFSYNSVHKILETFFSDQNILRNYMEISFFFSLNRKTKGLGDKNFLDIELFLREVKNAYFESHYTCFNSQSSPLAYP